MYEEPRFCEGPLSDGNDDHIMVGSDGSSNTLHHLCYSSASGPLAQVSVVHEYIRCSDVGREPGIVSSTL